MEGSGARSKKRSGLRPLRSKGTNVDARVDGCWRVTGDYVTGTNRNKQLKFSDISFQIDPDLNLTPAPPSPPLRLKTACGFHAELDSSGSYFFFSPK